MKFKVAAAIFAVLLFLAPLSMSAQQQGVTEVKYNGTSTKFAIMVSDILHFRAAIMTAEELNIKKNRFSFEIIIVGELAKHIVEDASLLADIDKSEKLGVKIALCTNALAYFNVPADKLDKRIQKVKNGWIYFFELKDRGFNALNV